MANHKSAAKRARQSLRRAERHSRTRSELRTWEKKLRQATAGTTDKTDKLSKTNKAGKTNNTEKKEKREGSELLPIYTSKIMKAAQKGVIKRQTAARKISQMSSKLHATSTSTSASTSTGK